MADKATRHIATIVGSNIRQAREVNGWSQHELALKVGARADQVSVWELGRHRPSDRHLPALCKALGYDLAWFYTEHKQNGRRRTPT